MTFLSRLFWKKKQEQNSLSVPLGKPIKSKYIIQKEKIRTFINNKRDYFLMQIRIFSATYEIKAKFWFLVSLTINILVTGLVINYVVENRNILSYGLLATLVWYYFEKVVEMLKKPYLPTNK